MKDCPCSANPVGDIFTDTANTLTKGAIKTVTDAAADPIKAACKEGAIIAIKDYSIPVTLGIGAILTTFTTIGFYLGKHFRSKS